MNDYAKALREIAGGAGLWVARIGLSRSDRRTRVVGHVAAQPKSGSASGSLPAHRLQKEHRGL